MINESFVAGFVAGLGAAVVLLVVLGLGYAVIRPWLRLKMSGGHGSLFHVLGMRFRGTPAILIVDAYTSLLHSGETVRLAEVESQYLAHRAEITDVRDLIDHVKVHRRRQDSAGEKADRAE